MGWSDGLSTTIVTIIDVYIRQPGKDTKKSITTRFRYYIIIVEHKYCKGLSRKDPSASGRSRAEVQSLQNQVL